MVHALVLADLVKLGGFNQCDRIAVGWVIGLVTRVRGQISGGFQGFDAQFGKIITKTLTKILPQRVAPWIVS